MTVATVMADRKGGLAFLVGFEGIKYAFSDHPSGTWSGLTQGWTVVKGALRRQDLIVEQSVNLASGELRAGGMTFRLVDGFYGGTQFFVSGLMTGLEAAAVTPMADTLFTGAGPIVVDSTAAFPSSGDVYIELETIGYTATAAGEFQTLTRGKYGSKEVTHTYDAADAGDVSADLGLIQEVTDRPVAWYGRRCWFYVAEILPDGTLGSARLIWKGRVTGDITCDGGEWSVPAESLWDALSTEILSGQARTVVKGILLEANVTLHLSMHAFNGAANENTSFTVTAGHYSSLDALLTHITDGMNAAIVALAGPTEQYELFVENGYLCARQTAPAGISDYETHLFLRDATSDAIVLAAALGIDEDTLVGNLANNQPTLIDMPEEGGDFFVTYGRAAQSVFAVSNGITSTIPVERADDFSSWRDAQDTYYTQSVVTVGGQPYILNAVTLAADTLDVFPFTDFVQGLTKTVQVQRVGDAPIEVRQGVWIRGQFPNYWRDAFIDHASVSYTLTAGMDSGDIDWTDLASYAPGGVMGERDRLLTEPTSFQSLFLEDLRWAGLVPVIEDGLVTARPIANQGLVRDDGSALPEVGNDTLRAGDKATLTFGTSRVVNRLDFVAKREQGRPGIPNSPAMEIVVNVNERQSQGRYRLTNKQTIECSGVAGVTEADIGAHAYGIASSYFALLARPFPVCSVGCTGTLFDTLPLDSIYLTHWLLPTPDTANSRGITDGLCVVLGTRVNWCEYTVDLDLLLLTDGAQRSGFAPAAKITAYSDQGAGTEPSRYRLTVTPGSYSANGEDNFFAVDMRVELREWDDDSAPASESRVISAVDPTNDYLYISAAPSAGMQTVISTGVCVMTLDQYDTASQTAGAKLYLHVADDADNLLGTSGVFGFKMG